MKFFDISFLLGILALVYQSQVIQSQNSTVNNSFNTFNLGCTGTSETAVEHVMQLFYPDLIHSSNLILYGTNESRIKNIQQTILEHPLYSNIVSSTIVPSENQSFKNLLALASTLPSFYTDHQMIFFIQPESLNETSYILTQINSFFQTTPSKSFTVYFFISWPLEIQLNIKVNHEIILEALKSSVFIAPIDCHLYILFKQVPFLEEIPGSGSSFASNSGWKMWEFYRIKEEYLFKPVGTCYTDGFLHVVGRRRDFRGTTVRALVEGDSTLPLLTSFNEVNGSWELKGGISYGFIMDVGQLLNFTVELVKGTGWIAPGPNGSLVGMGKQLLDYQGDIVLSLSEVVEFRAKYLAASHPTAEFKVNAYFQQPPPGLYRDIYLQAFSPGLWGLMSATWIVVVLCLVLIVYIKKCFKVQNDDGPEEDEMIAGDALYWALGAVCQTGWHYTPSSTSLRIIFICGLVSGLVYYTAYSASIISIFSVELQNFKSLAELIRQGFKLYGNNVSWTGHYYVQTQAKEDGDTFNSRLIDVSSALEKIRESRAAYVISLEFFFYKATQENNSYTEFCDILSKLPRYIDHQYHSWFFRKFDPFRKYMNLQLTRSKEPGLIFRTIMDHARTLPAPCDPKKKEAIPLEIQDVRSAFCVLAAGFVLSLLILIFEIMTNVKEGRKVGRSNGMKMYWTESACCCQCHSRRKRRIST